MFVITGVCVGQSLDFYRVSFVLCKIGKILRLILPVIFFHPTGILQDLLTKAKSNRIQIPHEVLNLLTELHKKATLTAKKAQPFLNASDPDYYRLGFVARHAWLFKRDFTRLDTGLSQGTHFRQEARFAGKAMDQCISDLIGDPRTGAKPCNITDECWRFIGRNNTQGYMTTHQALYLMVGEVKGELY